MSDERKRSWKELDQARDRGVKIQKTISKAEQRENKKATQQAKEQLNSLFANSKLSKEKEARLQEIQSLRGKPGYYEKMTAYITEFGIPREWDAQLFFLDHRDTAIVVQVLEELKRTAPKENLSKQDLLSQKLKVIALSSFDSRILDKVKELQAAILKT
jgi:hypothetical protein